MNIFYLDSNIEKCAQYHCDKHVVKMITEYAQLLSIACRTTGLDVGYSMGNWKNHPCAIWTRDSENNFLYLADLAEALHKEWQYRYEHPKDKIHGAYKIIESLPLPELSNKDFVEPPKCMPDEYKMDSTVESYRNYYRKAKVDFATWKRREKPYWF